MFFGKLQDFSTKNMKKNCGTGRISGWWLAFSLAVLYNPFC
jgi:hypothetical protein